jgi:hypothetical protein
VRSAGDGRRGTRSRREALIRRGRPATDDDAEKKPSRAVVSPWREGGDTREKGGVKRERARGGPPDGRPAVEMAARGGGGEETARRFRWFFLH